MDAPDSLTTLHASSSSSLNTPNTTPRGILGKFRKVNSATNVRRHHHHHHHDHKGSRGSSSGEDEQDIPTVKFFLDNRLPVEYFKQDILSLIHNLRIRHWKSVSAEMASDLIVTRISGALTNAIYSIAPPPYIKDIIKAKYSLETALGGITIGEEHKPLTYYRHKLPSKLLLRVYGPQVGHLIDRDVELEVLARLSLKKMGPKLLGIFSNGRFEQYLDARPLTKHELRDPDVSVQIGKRMRELHDGIKLLTEERQAGPAVWKNIDRWKKRASEVLQILESRTPGSILNILQVGTIDQFFSQIQEYKNWLYNKSGGVDKIIQQLVFAHNDTQYGNILRFLPPPGSPLLAPRNEHRQLVVIDFEYSAPNVRGLELANHFCEWMSDYHDADRPHYIHEDKFPNVEEQLNLIHGYVEHGVESFDDEDKMKSEISYLLEQSIDWRPAVHIYWCIWGIVQAVIDDNKTRELKDSASGLYRFIENGESPTDSPKDDSDVEEEEAVFDYIAYSSQKAQLFWSDLIKLGLMRKQEYNGVAKFIPY